MIVTSSGNEFSSVSVKLELPQGIVEVKSLVDPDEVTFYYIKENLDFAGKHYEIWRIYNPQSKEMMTMKMKK